MDYRLNNEAIASCIIVKVLKKTNYNTLKMTLIVPLLMEGHSLKNANLTISYKDYLPMLVNSMSLLMQMGYIQLIQNELSLTDKGQHLCKDMDTKIVSNRLNSICKKIDSLLEAVNEISSNDLYHNLKIIL